MRFRKQAFIERIQLFIHPANEAVDVFLFQTQGSQFDLVFGFHVRHANCAKNIYEIVKTNGFIDKTNPAIRSPC